LLSYAARGYVEGTDDGVCKGVLPVSA